MKKIVGVIMGGVSSEREVSLNSGKEILQNLDIEKYEARPILIDKKSDVIYKVKGIDFALIALHGKFGEDGTIQSVFETLDIPYSGCGPLTSGICMDKNYTKQLLKYENINTADWTMVKSVETIDYEAIEKLGYPVFVKPNNGGSSVATNLIKNKDGIYDAVEQALKYDSEVMIEQFIKGDEITCCILNGEMLPVLSIKPTSEFFDYISKYQDGGSDEHIILLEPKLQKQVKEFALSCWNTLKCSVYVRVDMILSDGVPYVLELNTLPGMTQNSLFPKSALGVKLPYPKLLDKIIEYSLKEKR